jgi:hypothetical protein
MSFLRTRVKQLQFCLEFLGSSDVVLKATNLLMRVKEDKSSLKLFMQKIGLKENLQKLELKIKVEQVEGKHQLHK